MCGIAGIFHFDGQEPDVALLKAMTDAIQHRGPDDEGLYLHAPIGLGHRRLSILDLSPAGHQPMRNTRGDLWIIFNGEIYNYIELRLELISLGYEFHTDTDTEVILNAYEHYGTACLNKFNGMWAFALWDSRKRALFCSRDRFGVKPFYYFANRQFMAFASEPKALLKHPSIPNTPSESAIYTFLYTGISNQAEYSFFKDIRQLPPGHFLWIQDANIQAHPYWDLIAESQNWQTPKADIAERFRTLFEDSVRLRMRSDVPIGTCLSGGLDSSSIVCTAKNIIQKQPNSHYLQETFSSCFDNPTYDERPFIEAVLEKTGARANFLFPSAQELEQNLNALVYTQDEPFGGLSIFAQWCVMKKVQERGVKVLLDGQGSDEMLAGYGYDSIFWSELFYSGQFLALNSEIIAQIQSNPAVIPRRLARIMFPNGMPWKARHSIEFKQLISPEFEANWQAEMQIPQYQKYPSQQQLKNTCFNLMYRSLLPILRYEDRNSMAFSIEARVPFLDYRLVSFVFSLPSEQMIHKGWSKWALREAMAGILPEKIRWRRDKMGFVTPQELWLKAELAPMIRTILNEPTFLNRPFWNGRRIRDTYEKWLEGKDKKLHHYLWYFISTELWLRQFVDQRPQ